MKVELFAPGQSTPVETFHTKGYWDAQDRFSFRHEVGVDAALHGTWKCIMTNVDNKPAQAQLTVSYVFDRPALVTTHLALTLLDNTFRLILEALLPSAEIDGNTLHLRFNPELRWFYSHQSVPALEDRHYPIEYDGISFEGSGRMNYFEVTAGSGKVLLDAMRVRYEEIKEGITRERQLATGDPQRLANLAARDEQNEKWKQSWEEKVKVHFATICAQVAFSNIHLEGPLDIDVANIQSGTTQAYWAFEPDLLHCHVLVLAPFTSYDAIAADTLAAFGIIPHANQLLEQYIADPIEEAAPLIGRYLGEALARLCARESVFMRLTADDQAWHVQHTALPGASIVNIGGHEDVHPTHPLGAGNGQLLLGGTNGGNNSPTNPTTNLGVMPPEFIVNKPETLAHLDQIETIVIVMMENRSFDHMLGYLKLSRGPKYEGITGGESNSVRQREHPVLLHPIRNTAIVHSPMHAIDHVERQIDLDHETLGYAEGKMDGFAQDFEDRYPGDVETVMTYYTDQELTTYYALADSYAVCDHWFAAHPGHTWPNRWITLSGMTPELYNPDPFDPRMGFLKGITIFDVLTNAGIEWRVFESDLAIIRTFDNYRLDVQRVVPLENFAELAKEGRLPRVVFVEPNFTDFPPLSASNDDLAPTDLARGQKFIAQIYNTLVDSPQWPGTLFLITYDEHGGFYDHVPPPGTKLGPAEWWDDANQEGKIPKTHPEGPTHLGVRVPALVISPWVTPGSVCKEIFDHTSIIKTILLHNRNRVGSSVFTQFGPRVNAANHLGLVLDAGLARTEQPTAIEPIPRPLVTTPITSGSTPQTESGSDDFHESLRRPFLPKPMP